MMNKTYLSLTLLTIIALPGCWDACSRKADDMGTEKTVAQAEKQAVAQAETAPAAQEEKPVAPAKKSAGVQEIKSLAQFNDVLKQGKPVIADFFAPWCGPCKHMKPIFAKLADTYTDIIFVTVNNDDADTSDIFKKHGVNAFPTFVFFDKSGKAVKTQEGGASESDFEAVIKSTFKTTVNP